ncbi:unnamed protein product, partial [Timema podura]|nr:unnamed protein product [Timema podura]
MFHNICDYSCFQTSIDQEASELFKKLNHVTLNQTFGQARNLLERLQFLIEDLPEEKAGSLPAHADMFLWLGPSTDMQAALDLLPAGCDRPSEPDWFIPLATGGGDITLPTHFTLLESH